MLRPTSSGLSALSWRRAPWALPLTAPATWLFEAGVRARRRLYDVALWRQHAAPAGCCIVSVGGLEAGGTGKTPTAGYILKRLQDHRARVGLLTRGYGRCSRGLVMRQRGAVANPETLGDEAAMLVQDGLDVPVAACGRRRLGAAALAAAGCEAIVMDDGFSHRALERHLDIVTLRGESALGHGRLLPRGDLREPASSLARADLIWLNFRSGPPPGVPPEAVAAAAARHNQAVVMAWLRLGPVRDGRGVARPLRGVPVVVAAGIARPQDFVAQLQAAGARVCQVVAFADHHRFGAAEVVSLGNAVRAHAAAALVVTAKDAVKIRQHPLACPLWTCALSVLVTYGESELKKALVRAMQCAWMPKKSAPV